MINQRILQIWLDQVAIATPLKANAPDVRESAMQLLHSLMELQPDQVRSRLSESDEEVNRFLSWLLLNQAVQTDLNTDIEQAERLVDWAQFIAEFSNSLLRRTDSLEAHCEFYQGVLKHRAGQVFDARQAYSKA